MSIKTQYGNEITPTEAIVDTESGCFSACFATRKIDGQKRFYQLNQLRADKGMQEICDTLAALPMRNDSEVLSHETW
jgi:hypothetical protein